MPGRYLSGLSGEAIVAFERLVAEAGPLDEAGLRGVFREFVERRLELAQGFLDSAKAMPADDGINSRNAISRCYYAMHHAGRAVIFSVSKTDVTRHDKVWEGLPKDFPERREYQRRLKDWHSLRNKVDYSPYVEPGQSFRALQQSSLKDTAEFVQACRQYLKERGVVQ